MSPALRTVHAWAGVHSLRPSLMLLAIGGSISLFGARTTINGLGFTLFETPISLLLLVPTIAGIAVAVGSDNETQLPLPAPVRLFGARVVWLVGLALLAIATASMGQVVGSALSWQVGVRNTLLHTSLAVLTATIGYASMSWLLPVLLTLACMLFGYPPSEPGFYWWAAIMEKEATLNQWIFVIATFSASTLLYALSPLIHPHVGKHSNSSSSL